MTLKRTPNPKVALANAVASVERALEPVFDKDALESAYAALEIVIFRIETRLQEGDKSGQEEKSTKIDNDDDYEIKMAFKLSDSNNSGTLQFEEFFALLRQGDPTFTREQAVAVFNSVDHDLSAEIDFDEFVDYVFQERTNEEKVLKAEPRNTREEEAKAEVLGKSVELRQEAVKWAKQHGQDWKHLSWQERLEELNHVEKQLDQVEKHKAQLVRAPPTPSFADSLRLPRQSIPDMGALATPSRKARKSDFVVVEDMSQSELVDYSIDEEDYDFVGYNEEHKQALWALTNHLKSAGSPFDFMEISKYIAKGTAGWVFAAKEISSDVKVAMKLVRMTQARTCLREWFISKLLRNAGIENVVFTAENVFVLARCDAPRIASVALQNAGPVPYYVCLLQEFVSGGTLENLTEEGRLSPEMMFKALEEVASTLALMHANGVQHKDVKPENVLVEMHNDTLLHAKLCDFGSAEVGQNPAAEADDIRRFGVTLYSLATGESWTKSRLLREKHGTLLSRLREASSDAPSAALRRLPDALRAILNREKSMRQIAALMRELRAAL